jgi:putative hydrolase of the HAD superfamily
VSTDRSPLDRPTTVTFDCWATLLHEDRTGPEQRPGARVRAEMLAGRLGVEVALAQAALAHAWSEHQIAWHRRQVFDGPAMTDFALEKLGVRLESKDRRELSETLENHALERRVVTLQGARQVLERLAELGVRRALICDTGYASGRVVRTLLARAGLLELLEVTVFSDEVGVPKPHPKTFATALNGLGVDRTGVVHVGDLRRSDIAGGRAYGVGTVRLSQHNDDRDDRAGNNVGVIDCTTAGCNPMCERPEAHAVAPSYPWLLRLLGYAD